MENDFIYLVVSDTALEHGSNVCCMGVYKTEADAQTRFKQLKRHYATEIKKVPVGRPLEVDECFLGGYVG